MFKRYKTLFELEAAYNRNKCIHGYIGLTNGEKRRRTLANEYAKIYNMLKYWWMKPLKKIESRQEIENRLKSTT